MGISAKDVKALREKTGVGMMECKKALVEAEGDMDKLSTFFAKEDLQLHRKRLQELPQRA